MKKIILLTILISFLLIVNSAVAARVLKTVEYHINNTQALAANVFWNTTAVVYLPEDNIVVKSAFVEVTGVSTAAAAFTEQVWLNGSILGAVAVAAPSASDWFGYRFILNGTNVTSNPGNTLLYKLTSGANQFNFAIRSTAAANAPSAKAIITYEHDDTSATQMQTLQFFLNSSNIEHATAVRVNFTQIPIIINDQSPVVRSAWLEIGGLADGTAVQSIVVDDGRHVTFDNAGNFPIGSAGAEIAEWRVYINTSNRTTMPLARSVYGITDNKPFLFNSSILGTGDDRSALYAKMYVTYTYTTKKQATKEFYINTTRGQIASATFVNSTVMVRFPETDPQVRSAFLDISGGIASTAASRLEAFINGTYVGIADLQPGAGAAEAASFRVLINASNSTAGRNGIDFYDITDNNPRLFAIAVKVTGVAVDGLTIRGIINYNFTTPTNQTVLQLFVNSTPAQTAAGGGYTTNFVVNLTEDNVNVTSAWFELLGQQAGTGNIISEAFMNGSLLEGHPITYRGIGAGTPGYHFSANLNATNRTTNPPSIYNIKGSQAAKFNFTVKCTTTACGSLGSKSFILYNFSFTPPPPPPPPSVTITHIINETLSVSPQTARSGGIKKSSLVSFPFTASIAKVFNAIRRISQLLTPTEIISNLQNIIKSISQSFSTTEIISRIRAIPRSISDVLSTTVITDRLLDIFRTITQQLNVNALVQRIPTFPRAIAQQFSTSLDTITTFGRLRLVAVTASFTESVQRTLDIVRTNLNSITLTDIVQRIKTIPRLLTQSITTNVITDRFLDIFRSITQSLSTAADSIRVRLFPRIVTERITASTITDRLLDLTRVLRESLSTTVDTIRIRLLPRTSLTTLTITDAVNRLFGVLRTITNSVSITDNSIRIPIFGRFVSQTFTTSAISDRLLDVFRTILQSLSLIDVAERIRLFPRLNTLAVSVSESTSRLLDIFRSITQSLSTAADSIRIRLFPRLTTQAITISTVTDRLLDVFRPLTERISTITASARIPIFPRLTALSVTVSDSTSRLLDIFRTLSQSFSISDFAARVRLVPKLTTLSIAVSESSSRLLDIFRTLLQSVSFTDITERVRIFPRSLTQTITTSAITDRLLDAFRSITQSVSFTDIANRLRLFPAKVITQTFSISDFVGRSITLGGQVVKRAGDLLISFIDATIKIPTYVRQLSQSLSLSAITDRLLDLTRSITNGISTVADTFRLRLVPRITTVGVIISESSSRLLNLIRTLSQTLDLNDFFNRIPIFPRTATLSITTAAITDRFSDLTRALTESISNAIDTVRIRLSPRISTLAVSVSESTSRLLDVFRNINQLLSTATDSIRTRLSPRLTTLTIAVSDSTSRLLDVFRTATQSLGITDAVVRIRTIPTAITQTFSLDGITSRLASLTRPVSLEFIVNALFGSIIKAITFSFSIDDTVIERGQFVEFDVNIDNTGTTSVNVSGGISVYNSTDALVGTINSSHVILPVGSKNTIVTFFGTSNLTTGSYKADISVFMDGMQTRNITKLFNVTSETNLPIGNYTDHSFVIHANSTALFTANISTTTYVNISILADANATGGISLTEYTSFANQTISGRTKMGKFISAKVPVNVSNKLHWAWFNITYTDAEVTAANLDESSLKIWFYNASTSTWQVESNSNVDTQRNYVWSNITHFSFFGIYGTEKATPSPAPSHAPSGGGGGVPSTSSVGGGIVSLHTVSVEFVKWPVLREVQVGQTIVEGIKVRNKNSDVVSDLNVEVSGIPADWVSVTPKSLDLSPKESKGFTIAINVPKDTVPGDYRVLVTLKNSVVEDSNFLILRVKSYLPTYDKPIITRTAEVDIEARKTSVNLHISNLIRDYDKVEIDEDIPKSLAETAGEIIFMTSPTQIKRKDPLVSWNFLNFLANTEKDIEYRLPKIPEEFTSLIYFPIKQMILTSQKVPAGLRIVEFTIPAIHPDDATDLKLVVENTDNITKEFGFAMEVPSGWEITPDTLSESIKGKERKEFTLKLKAADTVEPGIYIARAIFTFDGDTVIREYRIEILTIPYVPILFGILGTAITAVAVQLIRRRIREARPVYMEYYISPASKLERIKKTIAIEEKKVTQEELTALSKLRGELIENARGLKENVVERAEVKQGIEQPKTSFVEPKSGLGIERRFREVQERWAIESFKSFWFKKKVADYEPKAIEVKEVPKVYTKEIKEDYSNTRFIKRPAEVEIGFLDKISEMVERTRSEMTRRRILNKLHKGKNTYDFSKKFKGHR